MFYYTTEKTTDWGLRTCPFFLRMSGSDQCTFSPWKPCHQEELFRPPNAKQQRGKNMRSNQSVNTWQGRRWLLYNVRTRRNSPPVLNPLATVDPAKRNLLRFDHSNTHSKLFDKYNSNICEFPDSRLRLWNGQQVLVEYRFWRKKRNSPFLCCWPFFLWFLSLNDTDVICQMYSPRPYFFLHTHNLSISSYASKRKHISISSNGRWKMTAKLRTSCTHMKHIFCYTFYSVLHWGLPFTQIQFFKSCSLFRTSTASKQLEITSLQTKVLLVHTPQICSTCILAFSFFFYLSPHSLFFLCCPHYQREVLVSVRLITFFPPNCCSKEKRRRKKIVSPSRRSPQLKSAPSSSQ